MTLFNNHSIRALTSDELPEITRIHLNAFLTSALTLLGAEGVRRYYEWQLFGPHDAIALGIFKGQILAGFCFAGIFRGALSGFLRKNKKYLTWQVLTHPWFITNPIFRERLSLARTIFTGRNNRSIPTPEIQDRAFGILSLAVDPELQGQGLGKQLMFKVEQIARERGFTRMHLSVAKDNLIATNFYEQGGWNKILDANGNWYGHLEKDISIPVSRRPTMHS